VEFDGHKLDFSHLERHTMREAVVRFWKAKTGRRRDVANPSGCGAIPQAHGREALTDIFEQRVESKLIQPTIIYDYPVETSPLSKTKPTIRRSSSASRSTRRDGNRQRLHRAQRSAGAAAPL